LGGVLVEPEKINVEPSQCNTRGLGVDYCFKKPAWRCHFSSKRWLLRRQRTDAFPRNEFPLGGADVKLGEIGGVPFYMSKSQFTYWEHTHLTIDVVKGNGGMFSLERPSGLRFLTRSRLYSDEEFAALPPVEAVK